jgi:hypothetical protein
MKTKKTAIEWLEDNLNFEPHDEEEFINNNKIWEQAKQMEKDEIVKAHNDGSLMAYTIPFNAPFIKGEEYYEENYGN